MMEFSREHRATMDALQGTLWVCGRCMHARENGEEQGPCHCEPSHEPWAREVATDVTLGVTEHNEWCTDADRDEGCDCGEKGFSHRACDGCGCPLGGDRYGYTWWA